MNRYQLAFAFLFIGVCSGCGGKHSTSTPVAEEAPSLRVLDENLDPKSAVFIATDRKTYDHSFVTLGSRLSFEDRMYFSDAVWNLGMDAVGLETDLAVIEKKMFGGVNGKSVEELIDAGKAPARKAYYWFKYGADQKKRNGSDKTEIAVYDDMVTKVAAARAKNAELPELLPHAKAKVEMDTVLLNDSRVFAMWGKCIDADGTWHDFQIEGSTPNSKADFVFLDFKVLPTQAAP